jgi:hypothetical protein
LKERLDGPPTAGPREEFQFYRSTPRVIFGHLLPIRGRERKGGGSGDPTAFLVAERLWPRSRRGDPAGKQVGKE